MDIANCGTSKRYGSLTGIAEIASRENQHFPTYILFLGLEK